MSPFSQENRFLSISDFGLGKDTFLLTAFEGSESISDLFEFNLEVLSENQAISPEDIIGKTVSISIKNKIERKFHGYISHFTFGKMKGHGLRQYKLVMVPWLWFLSKTNNHRIFQEKNVKTIVSQVFTDLGFSDFNFRASGGAIREYCIQHNESDLHFVSRLLEEEGICYYFMHEAGKHTLYLVDQKNAYQTFEGGRIGHTDSNQIHQWEHLYSFRKGQWTINDYDFKTPGKNLISTISALGGYAGADKLEHYEYPDLYQTSIGSSLVKVRMDAEEATKDMVKGESDCCAFYAGGKFSVGKDSVQGEKGHYILIGVKHKAYDTSYLHKPAKEENDTPAFNYKNELACIPDNVHFRPQQKHKRPVMKGSQTAVVVGPAGEEIYTDEYGRIKVQFIWDREGKKDENSSCFLRVMQVWAGNKWGASFVPRIGHEVIVSFLDGDPDRPIVAGSVYNQKNKPPYSEKTQSGIKSRSSKGGTSANFNEIRFEDKKGAEQLYIQAEKNQDNLVKNDESTSVGNNRTENVGVDEAITIGSNRTENVGSNETITIGSNRTESVGANESITIGSNRTENVGANETVSIGSSRTENVGSNETLTVAKLRTHNVGINDMLNVGAAQEVSVGGFRMLNVGLYQNRNTGLDLLEKVGKKITIDAGDEIMIVTGESSLNMKSDGTIVLKGKDIQIQGSGEIFIKAAKNLIQKAKKILEN